MRRPYAHHIRPVIEGLRIRILFPAKFGLKPLIMGLGIAITTSPMSVPSDAKNFDFPAEIGIEEWELWFLTDLHVPEPERHSDKDRDEFLKRWETSFKDLMVVRSYELLGRIWHYNRDVFYQPSEVSALFEECSRLAQAGVSKLGNSMLNKLMRACERALEVNSGIWLIAD